MNVTFDLDDFLPSTGEVAWIGVRPSKGADVVVVQDVWAEAGRGLVGDHAHEEGADSSRQVTLIAEDFVSTVAERMGHPIDPRQLRRNIVVDGLNLRALHHRQQIEIGTAILEVSGPCHPCQRMENTVGPGGLKSMAGLGGYCCRIIRSGRIAVGDKARPL